LWYKAVAVEKQYVLHILSVCLCFIPQDVNTV